MKAPANEIKAIIGLGNPEVKYNNTRHNTGFMIVDKILSSMNLTLTEKFKGYFAKKDNLLILLPATYMNLSGESIIELVNFYKINPKNLLVVFDDISLPLGTLRFRKDGSDGGHNGIKSIIKHLNSKEFNRLKVGIGPYDGKIDLAAFVLAKFTPDETKNMDKITSIAADAAIDWAKGNDFEKLQSKYNKTLL